MKRKISELSIQNISIVGLGYVDLPLAIELNELFSVTGFDIN